jgi:hypothetical protein
VLIWLSLPLGAQTPAPLPLSGVAGVRSDSPSVTPGESAADLLPGNGTRGGYLLRYAPVIPGSESVYVDGKRLTREVDYWIDYRSGNLAFAQPVRKLSSIQVYYRYSPDAQREGSIGALPIFTLSIGQASALSVLFTARHSRNQPERRH